jgi:hypothetical protein
MRTKVAAAIAGAGLILSAAPALAHHAFTAEFDAKKPLKLRGTVTRVEWINPHSWIHIDVKNPDGTVTNWMVEGGSPNALLRRGVARETLQAGMEVLVDGYQAKDGSSRANGRDITFADGRKLFVGSSGTEAPDERPEK